MVDRVVDGKPTSSLVMLLTANFLVVEQVDVVSHFQWTLSLNTTVSSKNHVVEGTGWFLRLMVILTLKVHWKFRIV